MPFSFPPLEFWILDSCLWEKQYHILDAGSEAGQSRGGYCLSSTWYYHLVSTAAKSPKGHSTTLSSQLLQDGGEPVETSEFHEHRPIVALHLL